MMFLGKGGVLRMQPDQTKPQPKRTLQETPDYRNETALIRRVASNQDCWFRWMPHAERRMAQYGHTAEDVILALTNGHVIRVDVQEDIVFRVRGKNIDGEDIEVAAAVLNATTIKVVTVI
jgi:hypothetical protein